MFNVNEFKKAVDREEFDYAKEMLLKETDVNDEVNEFYEPVLQAVVACIHLDKRADSYQKENLTLRGKLDAYEEVVDKFMEK